MNYPNILLLVIQLISISHTDTSPANLCPKSCLCISGFISCSRLTSFPLGLPLTTKSLFLSEMTIEEIPTDILPSLPNLTSLRIEKSVINTIREGAFKNLINFEKIYFSVCNIKTIETNAFSHIRNQTTIAFHNVTIDTIETHAFNNIRYLKEWSMFESFIGNIHTEAIHQVSHVYSFSVYSNQIGRLGTAVFSSVTNIRHVDFFMNEVTDIGCNVFDFSTNEFSHFEFYGNTFTCGCNLFGLSKGRRAINYSSSSSTKRDSPSTDKMVPTKRRADPSNSRVNSISVEKWSFDELLYRNWCRFKNLKQKVSLENYRSSDEVNCEGSPCFSPNKIEKQIQIYGLSSEVPFIPIYDSGKSATDGVSKCLLLSWLLLLAAFY